MREGLTYDDVLLVPQRSLLESRTQANTSVRLPGNIRLDVPVVSASMDSVTGTKMAQAMSDAGGIGIIHRFCSIKEQTEMVRQVDGQVGAAVGISQDDVKNRSQSLIDAGADFICVDVAHGHMESCISSTEWLAKRYNVPVMAGAVATRRGAKSLAEAGADMIRVGIGPGSSCLTREKAGVGVPQVTAIQDCYRHPYDATIIADGGIRHTGDIVKALMAGADAVVVGGLLAACDESLAPLVEKDGTYYKEVRGMASEEAQQDYDVDNVFVEGGTYLTEQYGPVSVRVAEFRKGIQSGISYCGGTDIKSARSNAEFMKISPNTTYRNGIHGKQADSL